MRHGSFRTSHNVPRAQEIWAHKKDKYSVTIIRARKDGDTVFRRDDDPGRTHTWLTRVFLSNFLNLAGEQKKPKAKKKSVGRRKPRFSSTQDKKYIPPFDLQNKP